MCAPTRGDVEMLSGVAFLDDVTSGRHALLVHGVHHLSHLRELELLQEIVIQDGVLYQLLGPETERGRGTSDSF